MSTLFQFKAFFNNRSFFSFVLCENPVFVFCTPVGADWLEVPRGCRGLTEHVSFLSHRTDAVMKITPLRALDDGARINSFDERTDAKGMVLSLNKAQRIKS